MPVFGQYSLRFLLLLMVFVAVSATALMRPSVWWIVGSPLFLSLVVGLAAVRTVSGDEIQRARWAAFLAIFLSYFVALSLVKSEMQTIFGPSDKNDVWEAYVSMPLWETLHGEVPYTRINKGFSRREFLSFQFTLNILIAVIVGTIGALTVRFTQVRKQ